MVKQGLQRAANALLVLILSPLLIQTAVAQTVTAVPKVDPDRFLGAWYEIARFPNKVEKPCVSDGMVLYAQGDKPRHFQMVTSCLIKGASPNAWDANGIIDKAGDGQVKISYIWPFSSKYWVLAIGPAYEWTLMGSPNHKTLWVLSRTASMAPEVLAEIKARAAAQGFDMGKLVTISHTH